jgi:NAD+ diphosphatase
MPDRSHEASRFTAFAESCLDRRAELRDRPDALAEALAHPEARVMVFTGDLVVAKRTDTTLEVTFTRRRADELGSDEAEAILLGWTDRDVPWIAVPVRRDGDEPTWIGVEMLGLRALLVEPTLDPAHMGPVAGARSLLDWHRRHGFCAQCGAPTRPKHAGWRRTCKSCEAEHFPRVDPVTIMLVTHRGHCLLGRQPRFAPGMYTCLAGFVEPGETVEDGVRREVREEAGIRVGAVRYHASQPWPFPSSLMIGCYAEATSQDIVVDGEELEDCRWFSRDDLARMVEKEHPEGFWLPIAGTLSRRLIDDWLAQS